MNSYQAIYDAARSKIGAADSGTAIREAAREAFDISYAVDVVKNEILQVVYQQQRPCVLFRPALSQDGNAWLAIYGDLPTGVVGTGATPEQAMTDFDRAWRRAAALPSSPEKE